MENKPVKNLIVNPKTGKKAKEIRLVHLEDGVYIEYDFYRWNSVYRVYNSNKNYSQLYESQLKDVFWLA